MSNDKKHIEPRWLMLGGVSLMLINPFLPVVIGASFFLSGLLLFLSGFGGWAMRVYKSRDKKQTPNDFSNKQKVKYTPSVTDRKVKVEEAPIKDTKTRQKRSSKLSESKVWRLVQVLYGALSIVVILMAVAAASQPTCTGGYGNGLSFYNTPQVCTDPDSELAMLAAVVALVGVVGFYYVLQWAASYIIYGTARK
jgi:hypothetical protein